MRIHSLGTCRRKMHAFLTPRAILTSTATDLAPRNVTLGEEGGGMKMVTGVTTGGGGAGVAAKVEVASWTGRPSGRGRGSGREKSG